MTDKKNSDQKARPLTAWQSQLPAVQLPQRKLAKQLTRLQTIGIVAKAAQDEMSSNFVYSQFKVLATLDTAAKLKTAFETVLESPEAEANLVRDTEEFLMRMQEVSEAAGLQILREQQRVPEYLDNDKPIEKLRSFFFGD